MSDDKVKPKQPLASVTDIEDAPILNMDQIRIEARKDNVTDSFGNRLVLIGEIYFCEEDAAHYAKEDNKEIPTKITDNTRYGHLPRMHNFDAERLSTVEFLARALDKQEILDYFGIVDTLHAWEKAFFSIAYKRGVSAGKREAMEKLFISMGDRNGGVQALNYLRTHATRFPSEGEDPAAKKGGGGFNFTVNLDD